MKLIFYYIPVPKLKFYTKKGNSPRKQQTSFPFYIKINPFPTENFLKKRICINNRLN